jgi:hypothetical protein
MPGNYWIKLYMDILDDSKMAILPDSLWRKVVELFLLAGRYNQGGDLPSTDHLAWDLRLISTALETDLIDIEKTGIIKKTETGWLVVSYAKRQAPTPHIKRQQAYRDRLHGDQYASPGSVPIPSPLDDPIPYDDGLSRTESIFNLFEDLIGFVPPMLVSELVQASKDYPADRIAYAFKQAADHGAKNWLYVRKVLENKSSYKRPGFNGSAGSRPPDRDPSLYESHERSTTSFDGDHAVPSMSPPALVEARSAWQKLVTVADNEGMHELVVKLYPDNDSDWRSIDSAAGLLRDELRKVIS